MLLSKYLRLLIKYNLNLFFSIKLETFFSANSYQENFHNMWISYFIDFKITILNFQRDSILLKKNHLLIAYLLWKLLMHHIILWDGILFYTFESPINELWKKKMLLMCVVNDFYGFCA